MLREWQSQQFLIVETHRPGGGKQSRQGAQQCRLPRPVRPHQSRDVPCPHRSQGEVVQYQTISVTGAQAVHLQSHHPSAHTRSLRLRINDRNTGTPINDVTIPIGSSTPGTIALLATEASDMIAAPVRALAGRKYRWSSPISMRAMCGPTRPMKPIVPTNATAVAANRLTRNSEAKRSRPTFTPKLRARSSPRRSAVRRQEAAME